MSLNLNQTMSREIKFRQPIFKNGKFQDFHYWGIDLPINEVEANVSFVTFIQGVTNPKDSQQFTGLFDRQGREIYEGDIVLASYNYLGKIPVKFHDGKFNIAGYNLSKCEVIGNIYENPELVQKK